MVEAFLFVILAAAAIAGALTVVLARQSHGPPQRLRLGLAIGVSWGLGEVAFIAGGTYIGRFPVGSVEPVGHVLTACWVLLVASAVTSLIVHPQEQRAKHATEG